ncbi:tape measure protein [Microbacterium sp. gxy059]|uniref:tape measure protein n=1 Tax=Microbacterium sp. gxy059 TaxID=2957199 RepID=UPI003D99CCCE
MAFNAGELVATIRLDGVDQFRRDARSAGTSLEGAGKAGDKVAEGIKAGMRTAATAVTGVSVATGAWMTSLFKTGAAYNTMQQTSRAALKTLLGSTEAVNAQMAKLDDFASNSPFSKATFLQAQQQLIGFGVEAEKVIPILSAVQDATAAVGGSNQQISEIVSILAKISSSGKITAEDLNMMGERGLDAAALLGAGFNQSAAEIRESITEGTIDAGKAVDVLTEQMTKKFDGAASNVKETWSGAVDRIGAAQREIGAALAEPFISQAGGGMAIIWGNQVADVLRAVLKHVEPIVTVMNDRLSPAFAGITKGLDEAKISIRTWDSAKFETFLNHAERYAPAIAALGGALVGWTGSMLGGIPVIGQFVGALNPVTGALTAVALASPEVRAALADLLDAFRPLGPVAGEVVKSFAGMLTSSLPAVANVIEGVTTVVTPLVTAIGEIPTPVLAAVTAFIGVRSAMKGLEGPVQTVLDGFKRVGEQMAVQQALGAMEGKTGELAGAFGYAGKAASGLGGALKAAFVSNPVGLALTGMSLAVTAVTAAMAAAEEQSKKFDERVVGLRDTLEGATGRMTAATREFFAQEIVDDGWVEKLDEVGVKSNHFVAAMIGNEGAVKVVNRQLQEYVDAQAEAANVSERSALLAEKLGISQDVVTDALNGSEEANRRVVSAYGRMGEAGIELAREYGELGRETRGVGTAAAELTDFLDESQRAVKQAAEEEREFAAAVRESRAEMTEAQRTTADINTAMEIFASTTSTAAEKTNALKQALDLLNGGTKTAEQVQRELNDQTRAVANAFEVLDENGKNVAKSLVNAKGEIDSTTEAGSNLSKQVEDMNNRMLDAVVAADEAAKARGEEGARIEELQSIYDDYTGRLRKVAEEAGLSGEQIQGLIDRMFDVPEEIKFLISDAGTIDEAEMRLFQLAMQIRDTPDGDFEIREDDIPGLMKALSSLGFEIRELPDGSVSVKKDGKSFEEVEKALNEVARARSSTVTIRWNEDGTSGKLGGNRVVTPASADGNLFDGGKAQPFANGGQVVHGSLPSGVYSGRPQAIYKFAEAETRWEAFLSGKVGQEARNREIAKEAVKRLGGVAVFEHARGGLRDTTQALSVPTSVRTPNVGPRATDNGGQIARQGMAEAGTSSADPRPIHVEQTFYLQPGMTASDVERVAARGIQKALRL